METWKMLDEDTDSEDNKEEANMGLVVTTSSGEEPSSYSDEDDEVIYEQICNEYIPYVKRLLRLYLNKSRSLKDLQKQFNFLSEELNL